MFNFPQKIPKGCTQGHDFTKDCPHTYTQGNTPVGKTSVEEEGVMPKKMIDFGTPWT